MADPNLVYLILLFGLWSAVTAVYIPGTGIPEVIALGALGGGIWMLAALPTNWLAVILLVMGVLSFLVVPFVDRRLAQLAVAGLVLQALGSVTLFNGLSVSWLLIAVTVGASLAYHRLILLPLLEQSRTQPAVRDDDKELMGAVGRVVKASVPLGSNFVNTINVRGEQWTALSDNPLDTGDEVVVVERDGLQLIIEGIKHKQAPQKDMEEV